MSRLKRLKEKKRKQFIKTIMSGLALTISIGTSQTITTYAWFTDSETLQSDLVVTMGTLDVDIGDGFNSEKLNKDNNFTESKEFSISNEGSLKEQLKLKISLNKDNKIENNYLKYINYKLYIDKDGEEITINLDELSNTSKDIDLVDKHGNRIILNPGDVLNCKSTISLNTCNEDILSEISNKSIAFNTEVLASQINLNHNDIAGFTDKEVQTNIVNIDKIDPVVQGNLNIHFQEDKEEIKIFIPNEYKPKQISNIKVLTEEDGEFENTGEFKNIEVDEENKYHFVIQKKYDEEFNKKNIGKEFSENNQLNIEIKFIDKQKDKEIEITEVWNIKFRMNKNKNKNRLQAYYQVISSNHKFLENPSNPDVEEPPKEEIENPSNPDVEEPPKEETENPSKPEVEEPPKEETENPSNPDVEEPPKEETENPSKPEVEEPPKEEIENPSKPEEVNIYKYKEVITQNEPKITEIQNKNTVTQV
ncbi:hypothetical protein [Romboutsia sp.]|uniref:hypothetical protein n=1 Tax=Romboutsia sp. TaxID=1965302 RepID=UPI003F30E681